MSRSLLFCTFLVLTVAYALADESKTVTIPLDQIWAWRMPGTRDIGQLEPNKPARVAYGRLVGEILRALAVTPPEGKEARPGFAVLGTGLEALREAYAVLVENKQPRHSFPANSEVTVVFLSYQFGPYVHLHHIVRKGNLVEIRFQFVPHETEEVTEHLALIPLGKLPTGNYSVRIVRSPMEQKYYDLGFRSVSDSNARRIVCQSFDFSIPGNEEH